MHKILHWGMAILVISPPALIESKGLLSKDRLKHELVCPHMQAEESGD